MLEGPGAHPGERWIKNPEQAGPVRLITGPGDLMIRTECFGPA
jgi:hypothetical protein